MQDVALETANHVALEKLMELVGIAASLDIPSKSPSPGITKLFCEGGIRSKHLGSQGMKLCPQLHRTCQGRSSR